MTKNTETPTAPEKPTKKRRQARLVSPRVTATVTPERIAESVRGSSGHCMIAEAIKDAYPGFTGITVDLSTVRFSEPAKQLRYTFFTPRPAQEALIMFDQGVIPPPFDVVLKRAVQITRSAKWKKRREPSGGGGRGDPSSSASLGSRRAQKEGGGAIPTIVGGQPLPLGLLLGKAINQDASGAWFAPGNIARRRIFGIKILRA